MGTDQWQGLLRELQTLIGYTFADPILLERALTHRSYAHENDGVRHNEAFELLGDAVLGFLVCEWLLERFPDEGEGRLAKIKAFLVSESNLDTVARELGLGRFLRLNRGEEKTGGREKRAILVDTFEALVAALYLDGGVDPARDLIRERLRQPFESIDPADLTATDYKSALQEALQASGLRIPAYRVADISGPDHRRTFHVDVIVEGEVFAQGDGQSIKRAEQVGARNALGRLMADTIDISAIPSDLSAGEPAAPEPIHQAPDAGDE